VQWERNSFEFQSCSKEDYHEPHFTPKPIQHAGSIIQAWYVCLGTKNTLGGMNAAK
jgi:hypothetical protein